MRKTRTYERTRFTADVISEAASVAKAQMLPASSHRLNKSYMTVEVEDADWNHDTEEEFFADYRRSSRGAVYEIEQIGTPEHGLRVQAFPRSVQVAVSAPLRREIEAVFAVFERHRAACTLPQPPTPEPQEPEIAVFIGHGRNELWRDLKDHLHEQHGYKVVAYEIGARAGHSIRDVLEDMLAASSFAILVMTGEDLTAEGRLHPRLNVVHEAGLFQGRLGFNRAIVLLEAGAEEFSNIHGLHQIRFNKGNIKEVFGEVLATLRREFT